jgi:diaminohydroxyphosphoribosylaminopyrimidine deaminase/5-amino-6-(5-phosphoribosylamino)uracil reductase
MRLALRLARRGYATTSPNPMVGAVLVKGGKVIGQGWHRRAGEPHAEVEAIRDAQRRGHSPRGSTLYVTLEPCSTHGRTPPCTDAIKVAGIRRVVIGATDPNPKHAGRGFRILRRSGIAVTKVGSSRRDDRTAQRAVPTELADECVRLNEAFNHWIVHQTPFVTVKAAMTLDGKIATASGESKWITGKKARAYGMKLRQGADAILVGINTILADDPSLTAKSQKSKTRNRKRLRRIVLDAMARTPLNAKVVSDDHAALTTIVVGASAPSNRVTALAKRVRVLVAPTVERGVRTAPQRRAGDSPLYQQIDLRWLLKRLGAENVTSLLVEGGGEVNASFLLGGFGQRVTFFYAPKILGDCDARKAVAGAGARRLDEIIQLREIEWRQLGPDLLLTARIS